MNKKAFQTELNMAFNDGTLMTPKHDPYKLSTVFKKFRTVLSYELADNLGDFILSGDFDVNQYENKDPQHSLDYFEIVPTTPSFFVPASGVAAYSPFPTTTCDRLVAVSGHELGWHLFGEDEGIIRQRVARGDLVPRGKLE